LSLQLAQSIGHRILRCHVGQQVNGEVIHHVRP
jgi:hypothetical protein